MDNTFSLGGTDIKIEVSEFKGKKRVDIRRWYKMEDGKEGR